MADPYRWASYGAIDCKAELPILDNASVILLHEPDTRLYVFVYGGLRDTRRDEVQARLARIRERLVKIRGVSPERVVLMNGGFREEFTVELWLRRRGAVAPVPHATVERKDVKFRRGKAKRWECEYTDS